MWIFKTRRAQLGSRWSSRSTVVEVVVVVEEEEQHKKKMCSHVLRLLPPNWLLS